MKSVLISIRPKWCELIASGKKTIEARKTRPKTETPFRCYIYETKSRDNEIYKRYKVDDIKCGQVIGEFVCDRIYPIQAVRYDNGSFEHSRKSIFTFLRPAEHNALLDATRLENEEIFDYLGGEGKEGYGWHISDLEIYDKPRELSEFYIHKYDRKDYCDSCVNHECPVTEYPCCECLKDERNRAYLYRPPQSWCYVEELE